MKIKKTKRKSSLLDLPDANHFDDLGEVLLYREDFTPCSREELIRKKTETESYFQREGCSQPRKKTAYRPSK